MILCKRFALTLVGLLLVTGLTGCGGGGGAPAQPQAQAAAPAPASTQNTPDLTGVVAIVLKDAPMADYFRIDITLTRVQLLGNGDPQTIFEGEKTFDLLSLQNFYDMLAVSDQVPVGAYDKIRLVVKEITLFRYDAAGVVVEESAEIPANGKVDLNPRGPFTVAPDVALLIELDLDAKKSFKVHTTGNDRIKFRPVAFVEIRERQLTNALVRAHGVIGSIAYDRFFFELCDVEVQFRTDTDGCIVVNVFGSDTSIFDINGNAIDFQDLMAGDEVSVVGIAVVGEDPDDGDSDSDSDTDGVGDAGDSDEDSDGDSVRIVQIDAQIIKVGPEDSASRLGGTALGAVDENKLFDFRIGEGQGFTQDSVIKVQVQEATRILSSDLIRLDETAIRAGVDAEVVGVLRLSDTEPDLLRALLIIVDQTDGAEEDIDGVVQSVTAPTFTLTTESGDRCVLPTNEAEFYFVDITGDRADVKQGSFSDLASGQEATAFGGDPGDDGCFDAKLLVVTIREAEAGT